MKFNTQIMAGGLLVAGTVSSFYPTPALALESNQAKFFDQIKALCGKAFSGGIVEDTANSAAYSGRKFILHIRDCSDAEIKIPLHIDDNASRILILTKGENGITLQHDHRHADGSSDDLTLYGGYAMASGAAGTANAQSFPESAASIQISKTFAPNRTRPSVWRIILNSDNIIYQVVRPGRTIKTKFDFSNPVAHPPKAWDLSTAAHD